MQEKKWFESKAIWGGIVAVLSALLGVIGYNIDPESQSQLITGIMAVASGVGGVLSIYGRVKAEGQIKK